MKTLQAILLEDGEAIVERLNIEELEEICSALNLDDVRRIGYLIALARREMSRSLLIKMLKALDNDEKINNAPAIETLNCIQKILNMDKGSESELAKLVFKKLTSTFSLKAIKNK